MNETLKGGVAGAVLVLVVFGLFSYARGGYQGVPSTDLTASSATTETGVLHLDYSKQLSSSQCNGKGDPIISVAQNIKNSADSGQAGNYWALDDFSRTIQVWATSNPDTYCAVVSYKGNFAGIAGQTSPGNTSVLTGKERGPIHGGYRAIITGSLLAQPLWQTNGNVGKFDYQCDVTGNCPGSVNWVTQYFGADYTFSYNWWGWIYRAAGGNFWINSSDGNQGDII